MIRRDCTCHISPPCSACVEMTEEEADAAWNEPSPPLPPSSPRAPYIAPPPPPPRTYPIDEVRSEGKIGVGWRCYMRSGEVGVWSSWWGIDDGSAEAEASDRLKQKMAQQQERK